MTPKELKNNIVKLINESKLPVDIIEIVLENVFQQVIIYTLTNIPQTTINNNEEQNN